MTLPVSEVGALAAFIENKLEPKLIDLKRGDSKSAAVLFAPSGFQLHDIKPYLDKYLTAPERLKGTAVLTDLVSFVAHVARFKDEHSALFACADPKSASLQCVLDYSADKDDPRFGEHRAHYRFPLSEEWQTWMAMDGKAFESQEAFAEFIEERIGDVGDPDEADGKELFDFSALTHTDYASPSKLLALSTGIEARVSIVASKKVNLSNGETQIQFTEDHDTRDPQGPMKVPGAFVLNIPIFEGDLDRVMLPVRLRYRLDKGNGKIYWSYSVYRADRAFDSTLRERAGAAAEELSLPLFYGAPEGK